MFHRESGGGISRYATKPWTFYATTMSQTSSRHRLLILWCDVILSMPPRECSQLHNFLRSEHRGTLPPKTIHIFFFSFFHSRFLLLVQLWNAKPGQFLGAGVRSWRAATDPTIGYTVHYVWGSHQTGSAVSTRPKPTALPWLWRGGAVVSRRTKAVTF